MEEIFPHDKSSVGGHCYLAHTIICDYERIVDTGGTCPHVVGPIFETAKQKRALFVFAEPIGVQTCQMPPIDLWKTSVERKKTSSEYISLTFWINMRVIFSNMVDWRQQDPIGY